MFIRFKSRSGVCVEESVVSVDEQHRLATYLHVEMLAAEDDENDGPQGSTFDLRALTSGSSTGALYGQCASYSVGENNESDADSDANTELLEPQSKKRKSV